MIELLAAALMPGDLLWNRADRIAIEVVDYDPCLRFVTLCDQRRVALDPDQIVNILA